MSEFLGIFVAVYSFIIFIALAMGVFSCVVNMLYAKKCGAKLYGLVWVPVGGAYVTGQLADMYDDKKMRVKLPIFSAVQLVSFITFLVLFVSFLFTMFSSLPDSSYGGTYYYNDDGTYYYSSSYEDEYDSYGDEYLYGYDLSDEDLQYLYDANPSLAGTTAAMFVVMIIMYIFSIVYVIFNYVALYRLFSAKDAGRAVMWLILSIFFGTIPMLIFMIKNMNTPVIKKQTAMPYPAQNGYYPYQPQNPQNFQNQTPDAGQNPYQPYNAQQDIQPQNPTVEEPNPFQPPSDNSESNEN